MDAKPVSNSALLYERIRAKRSFLCVGLDSDIRKIPQHLASGRAPLFEFNRAIIDATAPYTIAYKPNIAFYEALGPQGWESLERTVEYLKGQHPDILAIADAKRGDIGNTAQLYARAFFERMPFDAVTLAPYMGRDSIAPFLAYEGRWSIILAATSNPSAVDFQMLPTGESGHPLYKAVIEQAKGWGDADNTMFVTGATRPELLGEIRKIVPDHFLLVPGVGQQGGDLEEVVRCGMNSRCGLIVNSSRAIIYGSAGEDFAEVAGERAKAVQSQMAGLLDRAGL